MGEQSVSKTEKSESKPLVTKSSKDEPRCISLSELQKHKTSSDCWIAIHGVVVAIDKKLEDEHPGGPEVIYALAGKDVTEDFEDIGHSDHAREWAEKLAIGYLEETGENASVPGGSGKKDLKIKRMSEMSGDGKGGGFGAAPLVIGIIVLIASYAYYMHSNGDL